MIKIYSQPNCPKCKILKDALKDKKIEYIECSDLEEIKKKNIMYIPVLEVDNELLDFPKAFNWIKEQE